MKHTTFPTPLRDDYGIGQEACARNTLKCGQAILTEARGTMRYGFGDPDVLDMWGRDQLTQEHFAMCRRVARRAVSEMRNARAVLSAMEAINA